MLLNFTNSLFTVRTLVAGRPQPPCSTPAAWLPQTGGVPDLRHLSAAAFTGGKASRVLPWRGERKVHERTQGRLAKFMAIAPDIIEENVLHWPAARRIRLAEKLLAGVEDFASPQIEAAWNAEIESRVTEIREGRAKAIPAGEVMKEARKKLHEAPRLSPAGRRRTH